MKNTRLKNERETCGTRSMVPLLGNEMQRNCDLNRVSPVIESDLFQRSCKSLSCLLSELPQTFNRKSNRPQEKLGCSNFAQRMLHITAEFHNLSKSIENVFCIEILRETAMNQGGIQFLCRGIEIIEKYMSDFEFNTETMARELAVSRRQLFRKFKTVVGCTPNSFIRVLRLWRAVQLLNRSQMTITEITYAVGFSDLKYFRGLFRKQFGVLPTEYRGRSKYNNINEKNKKIESVTNVSATLSGFDGAFPPISAYNAGGDLLDPRVNEKHKLPHGVRKNNYYNAKSVAIC